MSSCCKNFKNDVDEVQQQLQDELEETQVLQSLIDTIIKEAQEQVQGEVSVMKNRSWDYWKMKSISLTKRRRRRRKLTN